MKSRRKEGDSGLMQIILFKIPKNVFMNNSASSINKLECKQLILKRNSFDKN